MACGPELLKSVTREVRFRDEISKKILRNKQEGIKYETRTLDKI
jgi:hypothetical protein